MTTKCSDCGEWFFFNPVYYGLNADYCLRLEICPECFRKRLIQKLENRILYGEEATDDDQPLH